MKKLLLLLVLPVILIGILCGYDVYPEASYTHFPDAFYKRYTVYTDGDYNRHFSYLDAHFPNVYTEKKDREEARERWNQENQRSKMQSHFQAYR